MKTSINYKNDLNALVEIQIEPTDYEKELGTEIKNYRKKVQLKGFRKGKTPISIVKKMYGQSILADIISKKLDGELNRYISDEKLAVIGQPLPVSNEEETLEFDTNSLKDYNFTFELGLSPKFEIENLTSGSYDYYQVALSDDELDKSLMQIRKSRGERLSVEGDIEENDMLSLNIKELDEDKKVKVKGLESNFSVLTSRLTEEYQKQLLSKGLAYKFEIDIYDLEPDTDDEFVRKHFLKLEDDEMEKEFSPYFEAEIVDIVRVEPAEMNEEFFTSSFGPDVTSESEAKAKIVEQQEEFFDKQSQGLLLRSYQDNVMAENKEIDYPDEFLKKWLLSSNEELTEEQLDEEYDDFIKNLTWTLIRNKLSEEYSIEVGQEEITQEFSSRISQYTQGMNLGEDFYRQTIQRMLQDRQQVEGAYEEIALRKLSAVLKEKLNVNEISVTPDELNEKIKEANEKVKPDDNQ